MPEGVRTAIYWALGVGIVALVVLVMSILFGNLSGNVGFEQESTSFINETISLSAAGETPATASGRVHGALSDVALYNASSGEFIGAGNYTITGVVINHTIGIYLDQNVNVSATVTYDSQGLIDTDSIIQNYTESGTNITAQLPTVGTIIGVALLLTVLLGILIFAIRKMMGITKESGGSMGGKSFGDSSANFG